MPENYSGEFECVVSREDAEGSWFFGEKQLSPSSKYIICSRRGRHSLSVKDVKKEDQGRYTFRVGEFQSSASLKMKCKLWAVGPLACLGLALQARQFGQTLFTADENRNHFSHVSDFQCVR